jgi:primase-polymerase (primpol)-like protein
LWESTSTSVSQDDGALEKIHTRYIKPRSPKKKEFFKIGSTGLGDGRILQLARNGEFAAEFNTLCEGNWRGKFPPQSEADFALCKHLAYQSGKNEEQIDRVFRQSGLMR